MKGLLLKDWYMMKEYCRSYLLLAVAFLALSATNDDNLFFVFYPCLLCGMIPVNLLGYDERSHWLKYSGTLPYTRTQFVSAKYLIGLFSQVAILLSTGIVQGVKMGTNGIFLWDDFLARIFLVIIVATLGSSITLPFVFKLGVEKGRAAYYVMIGFVCVASAMASEMLQMELNVEIQMNTLLMILALVGIGVYLLSWYLSIQFFKKREI